MTALGQLEVGPHAGEVERVEFRVTKIRKLGGEQRVRWAARPRREGCA